VRAGAQLRFDVAVARACLRNVFGRMKNPRGGEFVAMA
jgi:hypothetical protein